jgi:23S rRNA pseudouridine1911/1915/1917 synthase
MAIVAKGRQAVTHFRVLERLGPYALIQAQLETGRTHQIRVHTAYGGFPVVGDPLYGPRKIQLFPNGQALHAWQITFQHPRLCVNMTCVAPLPPDFTAVLSKLRNQYPAEEPN